MVHATDYSYRHSYRKVWKINDLERIHDYFFFYRCNSVFSFCNLYPFFISFIIVIIKQYIIIKQYCRND